jgi:hypothetical protein
MSEIPPTTKRAQLQKIAEQNTLRQKTREGLVTAISKAVLISTDPRSTNTSQSLGWTKITRVHAMQETFVIEATHTEDRGAGNVITVKIPRAALLNIAALMLDAAHPPSQSDGLTVRNPST